MKHAIPNYTSPLLAAIFLWSQQMKRQVAQRRTGCVLLITWPPSVFPGPALGSLMFKGPQPPGPQLPCAASRREVAARDSLIRKLRRAP